MFKKKKKRLLLAGIAIVLLIIVILIIKGRYLFLDSADKKLISDSLKDSNNIKFYCMVKEDEKNEYSINYLINGKTGANEIIKVVKNINEYLVKNQDFYINDYYVRINFRQRKNGPESPVFMNYVTVSSENVQDTKKKYNGFYGLQIGGPDDSIDFDYAVLDEFKQCKSLMLMDAEKYDIKKIIEKLPDIEYIHALDISHITIEEITKEYPDIHIEGNGY